MPSPKPVELLRDAIEAARRALRDLEADEIPAKVRRVAASSERTLPPPLAASLLRELGSDDFLRERALEAWEGDPPNGGPALASHAFLQRPGGWEATIIAEALAMGERHGIATDRTGELERESLAAEVASLAKQLREVRDGAAAREQELIAALEAERAPGRSDRQAEQRAIARLEEERAGWAAREAVLEERIAALESEARRFKERARAERKTRSELAAALDSGDSGGLPTDSLALARLLDDVAAHVMALAPAPKPETGGERGVVEPLVWFDASVRPDRAEAIDWLAASGSVRVLVDGYNLGFVLAGADPARARALAVEAAGRLAIAASGADVTVVFDSSLDGHGEDRAGVGTGGVTVDFTSGGSADDEIVERTAALDRVVVITNDRELRQRSEAEGAIALWSDALVEWSRRR